jgi:PAS domain S-box-containing protein
VFSENEKKLLLVFAEMLGNAMEHIDANRQIFDSEIKYRQISDNMSDMVWTTNLNMEIEYISPSVEKIFGYTAEEYKALPLSKRFDGESVEEIKSYFRSVQKREKASNGSEHSKVIEGKAIHKNGDEFYYTTTISENYDELGVLVGLIGVTRNIHSQKLAEIKLQESQQRMENLLQSQSTYVIRTDLVGRHTYWNKRFEEEYGWMYSSKGLELADAMSSVCDYHVERVNKVVMNCIQHPGKIFQVEIDKPAKKGGVNTTLWDFVAITNELNEPIEIQCVGIDISERLKMENALYKSEKRFSDIAKHSNTVIWEINLDGLYTYVNQVAEEMWGYRPDEIIGKLHFYDLHPEEGREEFKEVGLQIIKSGSNIQNLENLVTCKNGKQIWVATNATPVYDENGKMVAYIGGDNDINEKKLALEEAQKFRIITDQANYGSAITTLDGKLLYANDEMVSMHGLTQEEVIGNNLTIFHSEEQLPLVFSQVEKIKSEGGFTTVEIPHIHKDGSVVPTLMSAKVVTNAEGVPLFLSATALNITEAKKQEAEIIAQNLRLNAILQAIPDLIFINDAQGNYLEFYHAGVNNSLEEIQGLVGKNILDDFSAEVGDLHLKKIAETISTQKMVTYEYPKTEAGGTSYYECRTVFMARDRVLRFVRNITQQKASEFEIKKLSLAIEQSPVAIVITDLKAKITYASPAFYKMTGYSPKETLGMNMSQLSSGETPKEQYADLWDTILKGEIWSGELRNKCKNGKFYWENLTISPITNINGVVSNFMAVVEDISLRKKNELEILQINQELEAKVKERTLELGQINKDLRNEIAIRTIVEDHLQKAKTEAEKANQSKSEFLSRMSHELRTPMNSILGFAQLLEMGELNQSQEKGVGHILRSGKHLLNLINEVLDIAKIESGKISISLEPVDVARLAHEVMDSLSHYASTKNIEVHFDQASISDPIFVKADRQRLKQVFINLLNNALKYNHDGGKVEINVASFVSGELNVKNVRIKIQDNGLGISDENLGRIFHPFERIGAETTNLEGTGLGLAVVKQLTELMNGTVGVTSELGKGSCFWIDLPFSEGSFLKTVNDLDNAKQSIDFEKTHTGTILYIEDNISNIELVEQIITNKRPGITLVSHLFGLKTLELAKKHQPNLIMLDLNLPDAHGSDILKQLKADPETSNIPVIVLSADALPGQVVELMKLGARNYLTKPFEIVQFLQELDKYFLVD